MELDINYIKEHGLLLYEFIRGSTAQGTNTESSDVDKGGVFICPTEDILGLGIHYQEEVMEDNNNASYYEIGKYLRLLCNSNPTMLESLFIDDEFVLYEHPIITELKKHRDLFVTKKCFKSFFGYSSSQIQKAQGLNKLLTLPVTEKKGPLEFCYTFYQQGSTKLINWLDNHGLNQKYCGLVNVPNMHDVYGVYYDWKAHWNEKGTPQMQLQKYVKFFTDFFNVEGFGDIKGLIDTMEVLGYSGIVAEDGTSNTLRYIQDNCTEKDGVMLNSVAKGAKPICYISFNASGYAKHLRDYARYQKWLKERNPIRYENNKGRKYDAKNMLHSFRLTNMAIEIAKGEGVKVNRRNIDRDFLLKVKSHTYSYEELMAMLKEKEAEMHNAVETSTIPDDIDIEAIDKLLIDIRKKFYAGNF